MRLKGKGCWILRDKQSWLVSNSDSNSEDHKCEIVCLESCSSKEEDGSTFIGTGMVKKLSPCPDTQVLCRWPLALPFPSLGHSWVVSWACVPSVGG